MCVALAVFATNFPSRFYWTGGAFLRWDWLFYFVGGVCLVKKERPSWAASSSDIRRCCACSRCSRSRGRCWSSSASCGANVRSPDAVRWLEASQPGRGGQRATIPLQAAAVETLRALVDRIDRRYLSLFGGAALAVAMLMPISLVTSSGIDGYKAFIFNTQKHKETPLTNHMGLRTVVTYSPSEAGRSLRTIVTKIRGARGRRTKVDHVQAAAAAVPAVRRRLRRLLFAALRTTDPWVACSMGAMMMRRRGRADLLLLLVPVRGRLPLLANERRSGAILLGVTAATGFIDWAPTKYLPNTGFWANLKMSQWLDEQYMWMSVATLVGLRLDHVPVRVPRTRPSGANRRSGAGARRSGAKAAAASTGARSHGGGREAAAARQAARRQKR